MPVGYDVGMDKDEQLRFLGGARNIVRKIKDWSESRDGYSKAELEQVAKIKAMLQELKKIVKEL
jgi:hypothetical protein